MGVLRIVACFPEVPFAKWSVSVLFVCFVHPPTISWERARETLKMLRAARQSLWPSAGIFSGKFAGVASRKAVGGCFNRLKPARTGVRTASVLEESRGHSPRGHSPARNPIRTRHRGKIAMRPYSVVTQE